MTLSLEIHADDPKGVVDDAEAILKQNDITANRTPILPDDSEQRGLGEALGVIGFILALPGAIEDWTGYPAKQKTRETLRALIEWARTLPEDADLRLRYGEHGPIDLRRRDPDSIIDELALLRRP